MLQEHLGQHHGRPQLGVLPPQLQQLSQHREENLEESKLPLSRRQDLEVRDQETPLQEGERLCPHLRPGVAAEPRHALKDWAPGQVPQVCRLLLPGSLDSHGSGEQDVHQIQQLQSDVGVLADKLLVAALVSLVPVINKTFIL